MIRAAPRSYAERIWRLRWRDARDRIGVLFERTWEDEEHGHIRRWQLQRRLMWLSEMLERRVPTPLPVAKRRP